MIDETYDVFDKRGKKIGRATWTEVHTKGLLHRSACVLVFRDRSRKEMLLQRRSRGMAQDPGLWQHAAGGHVLSGDSPLKTAMKETKEELFAGMRMPRVRLRRVTEFLNDNLRNNHEISTVYECFYPGPFSGKSDELEERPRWVETSRLLADVRRRPMRYTKSFRNVLKAYLSKRPL